MMRNLGSVCAKVGRRGRWYSNSSTRFEDSSFSKSNIDFSEEKGSLTTTGLLLSAFLAICVTVKWLVENPTVWYESTDFSYDKKSPRLLNYLRQRASSRKGLQGREQVDSVCSE